MAIFEAWQTYSRWMILLDDSYDDRIA